MPFHSPAFFLLCLVTLGLYYRGGARWQHSVLLVASLAFYYYAGLADTLLLLSVVAANHLLARLVERRDRAARRGLATIIAINLGVLACFKYPPLFARALNLVPSVHLSIPAIVIPLGISFYIFQLIAYQVDLYRGLLDREQSFWRMLLYILFFPHHQAGPIMRPNKFLPQFYGEKKLVGAQLASGGLWILWGLAKKVLADNIAQRVDPGFANTHAISSMADGWLLALSYTLQIYGDFSGYSDIALGLGKLFGYELDRNFDQPYLARDPSMFWRRWHITLSNWLRDYLYIPLGGNRRGEARTYVNLMVTMVLGGLWHGASAMFILWGFLHGLLLVVHKSLPGVFAGRIRGWAITFAVVVIAWVPFRAPSWGATVHVLSAMAGLHGLGRLRVAALAIALLGFIVALQGLEEAVLHHPARRAAALAAWCKVPSLVRGAAIACCVLGIVLSLVDHTAYIYFRF